MNKTIFILPIIAIFFISGCIPTPVCEEFVEKYECYVYINCTSEVNVYLPLDYNLSEEYMVIFETGGCLLAQNISVFVFQLSNLTEPKQVDVKENIELIKEGIYDEPLEMCAETKMILVCNKWR